MDNIKVNLKIKLPGSMMFSELDISKAVINHKNSFHELNDKHVISLWDAKRKKKESITFYTKKCKPAFKQLNLTYEAYEYMTSKTAPEWYKGRWNKLNENQRLEMHLNRIAAHNGGVVDEYIVFED